VSLHLLLGQAAVDPTTVCELKTVEAGVPSHARLSPSRASAAAIELHAPHLTDPKVDSGPRRRVAALQRGADAGWTPLDSMRRLGMTRYPVFSLVDRVWEIRDNPSAFDGSYIALAELVDCNLLTADARPGWAPDARSPWCPDSGS
jgi:predicted nucleic acid-binding protein